MIFFIFFLFSHSYIALCMFNVWFLLLLSNFSRVIWLGDLNYRVALTYEETRVLLENNDWDTLLEKDQVCTLICPPQAFQYSLCHWNITLENVNEYRTALVKNLIKEKFLWRKKKKTINVLIAFFISHKSDVKTFLKWILNQCYTVLVNMTITFMTFFLEATSRKNFN